MILKDENMKNNSILKLIISGYFLIYIGNILLFISTIVPIINLLKFIYFIISVVIYVLYYFYPKQLDTENILVTQIEEKMKLNKNICLLMILIFHLFLFIIYFLLILEKLINMSLNDFILYLDNDVSIITILTNIFLFISLFLLYKTSLLLQCRMNINKMNIRVINKSFFDLPLRCKIYRMIQFSIKIYLFIYIISLLILYIVCCLQIKSVWLCETLLNVIKLNVDIIIFAFILILICSSKDDTQNVIIKYDKSPIYWTFIILFFVLCTIQGVLFILLSLAGTDFNLFNQSILNVLRESFVFRLFELLPLSLLSAMLFQGVIYTIEYKIMTIIEKNTNHSHN